MAPHSRPVAPALLSQQSEDEDVNWFNLSLVGWVILIIAGVIAAYMLHAPTIWIAIGALALLGVAVITSVKHSKPQV